MRPEGSARLRKLIHVLTVGFALTLRWLTLWQAVALSLLALLFNVFLLRRIFRGIGRNEGTTDIGIVLHPVAMLALVLMFPASPEATAAMWAVLALGDGFAALVGMSFGSARLPWNPSKSWAGSAAYLLFGGAGACGLFVFTLPRHPVYPHPGPLWWTALICPLAAAALAAFVESLPTGIDDNITAPILGGLLLAGLLRCDPRLPAGAWHRAGTGILVNLAFACLALVSGGASLSGALAGLALGAGIYSCLGLPGFMPVLAFVALGTAATKIGYRTKLSRGLAQENRGRRGARHALANVGCPFALSIMALLATDESDRFLLSVGFAGALAAALSDTAASEIGKLWGRNPFLIGTFRPVAPGTKGAVSLEGSTAGLVGALALALAAGPLLSWNGRLLAIVAVSGFLGMRLESFLGTLAAAAKSRDDFLNFCNTVMGALVTMGLARAFVGTPAP